jgi:glutaminyl-peptide cyclotransferase
MVGAPLAQEEKGGRGLTFSFSRFWTRAFPSPDSGILSAGRIGGRIRRTCSCSFRKPTPIFRAPSFERLLLVGWEPKKLHVRFLAWSIFLIPLFAPATASSQQFDGAKAYEYAREFAAIGPRWPTGPGHIKAEEFLRAHFRIMHDQLEEDTFTADTPIGPVPMCNFIVRFPGKKPGVIVLGTHYETNYPLRTINFVGANDGASTTGLLMTIADQLRAQAARSPAKKLEGYSVWLVFFDGEEAIQQWSRSDSTYGSRHLAAEWGRDGTLNQIKAFMLADMIGDKDLDIQRETHSTAWLVDLVAQAAKKSANQRYFFQKEMDVEDDHLPFVERGVPSIDIIDLDYGPNNSYHHTAQDTMDKISAHSLTIDGDVFMETIRLIDQR